jgi:hypothetical protein
MNLSRTLIAIAVVACVAVPSADAMRPPAPTSKDKKLYHWVGADGKDHYSDDLPPEALDQAREELSKSGIPLKTIQRAQTVEEKAAAQAKADADARAAEIAAKSAQGDQVLLSSYPTEAELRRAYDERIDQQTQTLKTIRIDLQSQQQSLHTLLVTASNIELTDKPVNTDLVRKIQTAHAHVLEDQKAQVQQMAQAQSLREESAAQLARYRSLRAAADARHAGDDEPASAPPTKG